MKSTKATLLIPVENQVRELDPKLLLACITSFPRSLYLCKSFTVRNVKMFRIMAKIGHKILSWDEEALVHLPPEIYFSRRLSPRTMQYLSHLFAWGEDNAELWRQYPEFPPGFIFLVRLFA